MRYSRTGSPRVATVRPFSVREDCTLGGRVFKIDLCRSPPFSSNFSFCDRTLELIGLSVLRSCSNLMALSVYSATRISIPHFPKIALVTPRFSLTDRDGSRAMRKSEIA